MDAKTVATAVLTAVITFFAGIGFVKAAVQSSVIVGCQNGEPVILVTAPEGLTIIKLADIREPVKAAEKANFCRGSKADKQA